MYTYFWFIKYHLTRSVYKRLLSVYAFLSRVILSLPRTLLLVAKIIRRLCVGAQLAHETEHRQPSVCFGLFQIEAHRLCNVGEKGLCVHVRSRRLPFSNLTSWAVPRWKGWLRRGFYCWAAATWCWLQSSPGALRRVSSAVFSLSKCWEKWVKWSSVLVLHLTGDGRCKSALSAVGNADLS